MTESVPASGQTPGAGDKRFGAMKEHIATLFGLDLDPRKLAFCGAMVQDVIDDLNRKKLWRFNLIASDTTNTVSGTADYSVPSDLWRLYSTRKTDDIDYNLTNLQQQDFDILFQSQNNITGFPYVQSTFNIYRDGTVKLFPTPDGVYNIVWRYFKLIAKPTGDNDFLDLPRPYQVVPQYGACARIAAMVDKPAIAYWEGKFQEAYGEMNMSDEDMGDEHLRFINIEEMDSRGGSFINPALRPRYLDFY